MPHCINDGPNANDDAELRSLGRHRLKDPPDQVELWQVDAPGLEVAFPPIRTLDVRRTNLPLEAGELIGRGDEVARIPSVPADRRLVTLTGPGGTGKTRLAGAVGASLLDNFEQALSAAALVSELLDASPGSKALGTSRAALRVGGEQELPIEPSALPSSGSSSVDDLRASPAVVLFLARATEVRPNLEPSDDDVATIAKICRRS